MADHLDTDAVLDLLREVSARVVEPRFGRLADGEVTSKRRPGDLVTVADREAEQELTAALTARCPGALMVGEEAVAAEPRLLRGLPTAEHAFTVDPVDGTRHFVAGSPDHAMMLAELRRGETVRAWIWQPQHRRAYVAERGAGAWCDGQRLAARPRSGAPRWTGTCCGVDYPRLATGAADVAAYLKTKPWDHLPGGLLLREAGGRVRRLGPLLVATRPPS